MPMRGFANLLFGADDSAFKENLQKTLDFFGKCDIILSKLNKENLSD